MAAAVTRILRGGALGGLATHLPDCAPWLQGCDPPLASHALSAAEANGYNWVYSSQTCHQPKMPTTSSQAPQGGVRPHPAPASGYSSSFSGQPNDSCLPECGLERRGQAPPEAPATETQDLHKSLPQPGPKAFSRRFQIPKPAAAFCWTQSAAGQWGTQGQGNGADLKEHSLPAAAGWLHWRHHPQQAGTRRLCQAAQPGPATGGASRRAYSPHGPDTLPASAPAGPADFPVGSVCETAKQGRLCHVSQWEATSSWPCSRFLAGLFYPALPINTLCPCCLSCCLVEI